MKRLIRYFTNGVVTIVPIGLVVYVVYNVFTFLDNLLGFYLRAKLGRQIPGLGLVVTILLITLFGWLATKWLTRTLLDVMDRLLRKIPLVKSLYSIVQDTVRSVMGEKRSFSHVVLVKIPESGIEMLGFITSEDMRRFGERFTDHVAVYFPLSFQISGYVALVPRDRIMRVDIPVEEAMKFVLSAGVTGS